MADLNAAKINVSMGEPVCYSKRKGLIPQFARFLEKRLVKLLRRIGYETTSVIREDEFKHPIGIAIDANTIRFGSFAVPSDAYGEPEPSSVSSAKAMAELRKSAYGGRKSKY